MGEWYQEAWEVGEELLRRVQVPTGEIDFAEVTRLLAQREEAAQQANRLVESGQALGDQMRALQALMEQQRLLEQSVRRKMLELAQASEGMQAKRTRVQGVRQSLSIGAQPRLINERR